MKGRSLVLIVLLASVSGAGASAAPDSTDPTYRVAIYSIRDDGTGRRLVAQPDPPVTNLVRSPDGRSILYAKEPEKPDGDWALVLAENSGANPVRLSPAGVSATFDPRPAFSPDGQQIAFSTFVGCGFRCAHYTLHVVDRDGTNLRLVGEGAQPSWSSDGRRFAYTGMNGIYVHDTESNVSTQIAPGYRPVWAPRGQRIAFNRTMKGYGVACLVNADGSRIRCAQRHSRSAFVWARDGKRVAFRQATPLRLGVMDSDARLIRYLGNRGRQARPAAWSPNGKQLAYLYNGYRFNWAYLLRVDRPSRPVRVISEPNSYFLDLRWQGRTLTYVVSQLQAP